MSDDALLISRDGPVAVVTLNRPGVHNALNRRTLEELSAAVNDLAAHGSVRAIVLTGAGEKAFSAGADLDELSGLNYEQASAALGYGQSVMLEVSRCPVPVIAAVNGVALGGGFELALAASFVVVSTRASFGLPESGLGLIPGYGGTQRLPRLVGPAVAAYLMLSGRRLSAGRAYELGLAPTEPVEPADLLENATQIAVEIARRGPMANSAILQALQTTAPPPAHLEAETSLAAAATAGPEAAEGIAAFKARRQPEFAERP
ncbi:enoyl-CoA hydratase/isomerase family protein [Streptomyces sp. NPDC090088]|uniref:enoyl-CoA hydratase/isomerase family protein n=1 Tax=Streptomyces sp. NPDC090088 TaxID=3365944 RepID=UPI0038109300